jgi:WD40 repeat protein
VTYRYDAFISYSHSADAQLAPELQRLIRRVGKPWYKRSTLRIFRDQTNLQLSESAWDSIEDAMEASESFVLMASPEAAESPWVDREVQFWRQHRSRSTFSIVVTNGDIRWDSTRGDFNWDATTALPRSLSGWFDDEPLWSDARPPPDLQTHRHQRNDRLRDAARTIAAPLYGVEKDQLDGEDERESRRARRTLRAGIAALSLLTALAVVAAIIAYQQRGVALAQRDHAIINQVITEADEQSQVDQSLAAQLNLLAYRRQPTPDLRTKLLAADGAPLSQPLIGHTDTVFSVAFSPGGHTLASGGVDNMVRLWNMADPAHPTALGPPLPGHTNAVYTVAFSPDGHTLASGSVDHTVRLWNVTDPAHPTTLGQLTGHTDTVEAVTFSPDGHTLASGSRDPTVRLWNLDVDSAINRICATTGNDLTPAQWQQYAPGLPPSPLC